MLPLAGVVCRARRHESAAGSLGARSVGGLAAILLTPGGGHYWHQRLEHPKTVASRPVWANPTVKHKSNCLCAHRDLTSPPVREAPRHPSPKVDWPLALPPSLAAPLARLLVLMRAHQRPAPSAQAGREADWTVHSPQPNPAVVDRASPRSHRIAQPSHRPDRRLLLPPIFLLPLCLGDDE
jgi:hypothetical protein